MVAPRSPLPAPRSPLALALADLVATDVEHQAEALETLRDRTGRELRSAIDSFAGQRSSTPHGPRRDQKRELVRGCIARAS
ncbi:hypothetical protein [Streptomyces sp. CB00455]|uniref:hypothetical protein n=1 Tax=Streptomyces sp. CB00455 TaxID=1703927 RepID=UPI000A6776D9|nr:hypothetical protein [Streptomyces sp. CB00455]